MMLKQRIITALILAPLVVWAILSLQNATLSMILGVVFTLGAWEWSRLVGIECHLGRIGYSAIFPVSFYFYYPLLSEGTWLQFLLTLAAVWWALALLSVVTFPRSEGLWKSSALARAFAGPFVLIPSWGALTLLHSSYGPGYFILLMLIIWGADSGAYFAGRAFGKHKLAPHVSPGKSWEGVIGGLLTAVVIAVIATQWLDAVSGLTGFITLVVLTVFISVLGDLTESLFKRVMTIKDSGTILPGHGGVLDRIDSLTAAAPIFTLGLLWLSR
ncbi:MAG: phosphatidate cytidylyltransferase [Chromatiales bacterium]|nr:phosphatidate cytidylyltransferase [Chromatiales bacterium]